MTKPMIIITDCDHEDILIESTLFQQEEVSFSLKQCRTELDVIRECQDASVWINQYAPITKHVLDNCPGVKLIVRYGVGVNNIDLEAATANGVQICNVPDYGTYEVADHALALMLALTRKIPVMTECVKNGEWDYQSSIPIFRHSDQTVGIIGFGRIGRAFAQRVLSLGCRVIVYDTKPDRKGSLLPGEKIEFVSFEQLLTESDIVSIHCPLDTAQNLLGEKEFEMMKPTAYLINVSRGGIVDELALHLALANGEIAGAAMDVAEKEPISSNSPLLSHVNFLCTPHMAWYSEQAAAELKRKVAEESIRYLKGQPVRYPVNTLKIGVNHK